MIYKSTCPNCMKRKADRLAELFEAERSQYGKIDVEAYLEIVDEANALDAWFEQPVRPEDKTFVIDWAVDCATNQARELVLSYEAECSECGACGEGTKRIPMELWLENSKLSFDDRPFTTPSRPTSD